SIGGSRGRSSRAVGEVRAAELPVPSLAAGASYGDGRSPALDGTRLGLGSHERRPGRAVEGGGNLRSRGRRQGQTRPEKEHRRRRSSTHVTRSRKGSLLPGKPASS